MKEKSDRPDMTTDELVYRGLVLRFSVFFLILCAGAWLGAVLSG